MTTTPEGSFETATVWKRIVAYVIDYFVIVTYFGFMSGVFFLFRLVGVGKHSSYEALAGKLQGQAFAVVFFTLPVICYFAFLEASKWQASIGKHWMKLRVVGISGGRISRLTSFQRSIIKFIPWEIAHTGIWHVTGQPFVSPPGTLSLLAWGISLLLAFCWVASLFIGDGRTPYDFVAKTRVVGVLDLNAKSSQPHG